MHETQNRTLVAVYSSPVIADVQLVRSVLAAEGIHASVTEPNDPFSGLGVVTSEVLVWSDDEARAKEMIQRAQQHHQHHAGGSNSPPNRPR